MDWFSRHTRWLYSETKELSTNSIYRESYQFIGKTLVSAGNILVHKNKTQYFPVLIVYPQATPYIPPMIYMLNNEIIEDVAREYSKLSPEEIGKQVSHQNIWFFNRRHQNEDGSVCFVEMGDLHDENAEAFPIKDIIKRLRIWLSGRIPKDSREVELFSHFPNRTYEIQYLLPDLFFDREIVKGKFYAGLSSLIPANFLPDKIVKKTYMGVMIYGENQAGVTLPSKTYVNEQLVLFTHIPSARLLILNGNSQEKANKIQDGELIEGYWWEIFIEPVPFSSVSKIAKYIGNGDEDKGISELVDNLHSELNHLYEFIHVGLRFPGRLRETDWQMFRLNKGNRSPIVGGGKKELKQRLFDYSVQAVYQEYLTDDYFHMRNMGRAERGILKDAAISIVGCGALGSEAADVLCKAGVGRILLVDKEEMRAHNAVRHNLGIDSVSIPKALGMRKQLVLHNPFVDVKWNFSNILFAKIDDYFPEDTIGVSTIADDNIEAYLNELAINNDRTVFYCRALRGGKVARIFRVIPHTDACKACLGLYKSESNPLFVDIKEDKTLPVITNECNNPVRPASAADLKLIASIFARVIIDYMEEKNTAINHWIWCSESLDEFKLDDSCYGSVRTYTLPPHSNCPVCQKLEDKKIHISRDIYDFIRQESAESKEVETGGVLIGYRTDEGTYVISKASKPGPKAIRTKTRFEKDEEYCQKVLNDAYRELGEKGLYLGEWHYHPSGSNEPSGLDIKSLTEIAAQDNYRIDKPVMIILSPTLEFGITIHDKSNRCVQLPLNILKTI